MTKENLQKLESELRQDGYTRLVLVDGEGVKASNSYFWSKTFIKKDFNTNKDSIAYIIKYKITNKYAENGIDVLEPEVTVEINNNFGDEGTANTKLSKSYISPKHAQFIAEEMYKCGNKHIITKKFLKYHWNMFKNWFMLHIDTILAVIACCVFCAIAIIQQS